VKYAALTKNDESYLWYFPNGQHATIETSTSPDASPTDAWGSSAMLYALMEGLAGVVDEHKLFQRVRLSPRWIAAGRDEATVHCAYGASRAFFEYSYAHNPDARTIQLELQGNAAVDLHLLLPRGTKATKVRVNGKAVKHKNVRIEKSAYVDTRFAIKKKSDLLVEYA